MQRSARRWMDQREAATEAIQHPTWRRFETQEQATWNEVDIRIVTFCT